MFINFQEQGWSFILSGEKPPLNPISGGGAVAGHRPESPSIMFLFFFYPNFSLNTYFLFLNTNRTRETQNQTQTNLNQKTQVLFRFYFLWIHTKIKQNPTISYHKKIIHQQQKYGSKLSSLNFSFTNCSKSEFWKEWKLPRVKWSLTSNFLFSLLFFCSVYFWFPFSDFSFFFDTGLQWVIMEAGDFGVFRSYGFCLEFLFWFFADLFLSVLLVCGLWKKLALYCGWWLSFFCPLSLNFPFCFISEIRVGLIRKET
jgi:hypothetical protein